MGLRIDIIAIVPQLLEGPFSASIVKRAIDKGLAEIHVHDLRDYATNKQKSIDDYQFGGGAGMVISPEPLAIIIDKLRNERLYDDIIYLTPEGKTLDQATCNYLSLGQNLMLICGHYKGIDQRIRDHYVTTEISIGDYVLSGGELGAAILSDAIIRLIPGVLGDETSALTDSFQDGLLAPPVYTRPANFRGWEVPPILLSGNLKAIDKWREDMAHENTLKRRPDLLD